MKLWTRRRTVWVALLSFALAICAQAPAPATALAPGPEWKTFTNASDGFNISFPSLPDVAKRNIDTDGGPLELRNYVGTDGEVALMVGVCDYGSRTLGKDANTLLEAAKNGALQSASARLVSEKQITLGNYSGLQFEAEGNQQHFTARIYYVGSTLYQILVVSPVSKPYANATRFLDSFQVIDRVQG